MNQKKASANIIWLIGKEGKVRETLDKTLCCFALDSWIHKNLVTFKFELKPTETGGLPTHGISTRHQNH